MFPNININDRVLVLKDKLFEYLTNAEYNNNIDPKFITIRG